MKKKERVLKALDMEEPDMVPITELDIEVPMMEAIIGERFPVAVSLQTPIVTDRELEKKRNDFKIECYRKIGFDLLAVDLSPPEGWEPKENPDGTIVDLWGRVLMLDRQARAWVPYGTVFSHPEDFENFEFPNPNAPGWNFATEYTKKTIGDEMALVAFIRDPFAHAWEIFTPVKFVTWMYQRPNFIRRAIEKLTNFNAETIKHVAEAGADFIISGGDYCEEKGPMVPVRFFRDVIFPSLKTQVDEAHRRDMKFIKHTDGNINPLLADLADIVDGFHSLDPTAGVDIGEVKADYGDRLILMGNVAVDSLAKKSRDEVIEETKECIRKASRGGGHILSSSNSWAAGAKLDNCLAMVKAGRKWGIYPIRF
jgi:uroporphyrinogen-III decarboxylase